MRVSRRRYPGPARRYPRVARVNEVLREVVADELERRREVDDRLALLTVTAVEVEPDLRRARVLFAALDHETAGAVSEHRSQLQEAISRQVRLKRTPQLSFEVDPAVVHGRRVDDILRRLGEHAPEGAASPGEKEPSAAGGDERAGPEGAASPGEKEPSAAGGDERAGPEERRAGPEERGDEPS